MKKGLFMRLLFLLITFLICWLIAGIPLTECLIWGITLVSIFVFLSNLGKKINYLDVTAVAASISYLLMPLLTFDVYGENNKMASLWRTFMGIDKEEYFYLALPATFAFIAGLWMPNVLRIPVSDNDLLQKAEDYLERNKGIGIILIMIGLISIPLTELVPSSLVAVFHMLTQLAYVGVLYLLFSKLKVKFLTITFIIILLTVQSIITGMFGVLVYWSVMGVILLLIRRKAFSLPKKLVLFASGIVFLFFIQSIKHEYREVVWDGSERKSDPSLFFSLIIERVADPFSIFEPESIYKVVVRANQGFLVARTIDYVPKHEPFANGETVIQSVKAAVVPRLFWPGKPEVGGKENICRFLGDCEDLTYSYNIGQLGEAYVNFGTVGAWVYMFFYGYMLNFLLNLFKHFSLKRPTLLLWSPILFYSAMIVEADLLSVINTIIKGGFLCAICFFLFRLFLKVRL